MIFYLVSVILLIEFSKCDVNVELDESQTWTTSLTYSKSTVFKVTQLKTKYCQVSVTLKSNDPSFLIMAEYNQLPKISQTSSYKQGEKIDRISQLENRQTRFLKLKGQQGNIYINVISEKPPNSLIYLINIIGTNDETCENQCSSNGICKSNGCHCFNSFIGNDCSQRSQELISDNIYDISFDFDQQIKFFSIDLSRLEEQKWKLYFSADCSDCLKVIIYKTKALLQSDFEIYLDYLEMFYIEGQQTTMFAQISQNLTVFQNILTFAIYNSYANIQFVRMQIGFNKILYQNNDEDNEGKTSTLIYSIIPSIIGGIFLFIIIICIYRRFQRTQPNNVVAQDPFNNTNQNKTKNNQNQNEFVYQEKSDNCAICLGNLEEPNMIVVKIKCCHQFHQQCIQNWYEKKDTCPLCIKKFDKNEIY